MKASISKRCTAFSRDRKPSAAFDRLSKAFGPPADHEQKRFVGAVSLLVRLRRGET